MKDAVLLAVEDELATSTTAHLRCSRVPNVEVFTKSVASSRVRKSTLHS